MCHWCYPTPRFSCPSLDNIPKLRPCSCAEPRRMRGRTPGAVAPRPDLQLPAPRPSASQGVFKCQAVLARHLWAVLTATEVIGGNVTAFLRTRGTHTLTHSCTRSHAHVGAHSRTHSHGHMHTHTHVWGGAGRPCHTEVWDTGPSRSRVPVSGLDTPARWPGRGWDASRDTRVMGLYHGGVPFCKDREHVPG